MPHLTRRAWLAVGLVVAGLAALGVTIAGARTDDAVRGTDPLSADETETALGLARGSNPVEALGLGDDDLVLLIERHEENKDVEEDGLRRADVYVYSYDDDVLTLSVVDVATGDVDQSRVVPNTQLPLIPQESQRALDLATDDARTQQALATAYRQSTGRDLTDPATDLDVQPIIFRADANPATRGPATACGRHRCAQLLIMSTDDLLVNLTPIVDLSTGRVVSRTGFFS